MEPSITQTTTQTDINVRPVDFENPQQCQELTELLIAYSADIMGGGKPLLPAVAKASIALLKERPYALSFIAYSTDDKAVESPVGFANCFETIATFAAQPAINIHDLAVLEEYRGRGISQRLLHAIETQAHKAGCYKITLEVLDGNTPAKSSYRKFGFEAYELDPAMGSALFWQKVI